MVHLINPPHYTSWFTASDYYKIDSLTFLKSAPTLGFIKPYWDQILRRFSWYVVFQVKGCQTKVFTLSLLIFVFIIQSYITNIKLLNDLKKKKTKKLKLKLKMIKRQLIIIQEEKILKETM